MTRLINNLDNIKRIAEKKENEKKEHEFLVELFGAGEFLCSLASIILIENNLEISEINLKKILNISKVKIADAWPLFFPKLITDLDFIGGTSHALKNVNTEFIEKHESVKKKENENSSIEIDVSSKSEEDMGFGLFD
ncbi:acidic ribosomal protein P1 (nucleomorph) [Chroomonas mesostigmatica CCMP1168]|uniref:Acidic ribosomal protein P1 n=1 Tax=Chroomonas mesostigmatica CCMP1168 TaxID=1195612 RepID=J7G2K2_9CRYP|nr:acidic ribosomal protein P1 [Chroomonas mesostigmatica CCMP1168]